LRDSDATSFTPLYAINHRGVQLFAAPYAKRGLLGSEVEPAPAAANDAEAEEWSGLERSNDGASDIISTLPLPM
jgi:hypothetical protein